MIRFKFFRRRTLFFFLILILTFTCHSQGSFAGSSSENAKVISGKASGINYFLSVLPKEKKKYPLVLVFHGLGENPRRVMERWEKDASGHGMMVLVPAWMEKTKTGGKKGLEVFFEEILNRYSQIDRERVFVSGISFGGLPAQNFSAIQKGRCKGVILIAYAPSGDWAKKTDFQRFPPVFFGFGTKGQELGYVKLKESVQLLKERKVSVHLLADPEAGHEHRLEWNKEIFEWMGDVLEGKVR